MNPAFLILAAGGSFILLWLIFRPLEVLFPAKQGQRFLRPDWYTDMFYFLGQYLVWSGLVAYVLIFAADGLQVVVPAGFRQMVAEQPWWVQAVEVIFLSDLCVYLGHRLQHRVPILWRFHSIHHSSEHLDWLTATGSTRWTRSTR